MGIAHIGDTILGVGFPYSVYVYSLAKNLVAMNDRNIYIYIYRIPDFVGTS